MGAKCHSTKSFLFKKEQQKQQQQNKKRKTKHGWVCVMFYNYTLPFYCFANEGNVDFCIDATTSLAQIHATENKGMQVKVHVGNLKRCSQMKSWASVNRLQPAETHASTSAQTDTPSSDSKRMLSQEIVGIFSY